MDLVIELLLCSSVDLVCMVLVGRQERMELWLIRELVLLVAPVNLCTLRSSTTLIETLAPRRL